MLVGRGGRADSRRSGHREGGGSEGGSPAVAEARVLLHSPLAGRGPAPSPRAALGQGLGGGGGRAIPPLGKPGRGAGAPARRKSPKDREDGGGHNGRGAGTLPSSCGVTLARAPRPLAAAEVVEMPLRSPDFPAQSSSRNAQAKAFSIPTGSRPRFPLPALPCLQPQLPSR